jgi:hypothetical protein
LQYLLKFKRIFMQDSQSAQPLPDIFIGTEKAHRMIDKYLTEKYPLLQNAQQAIGANRQETKSVWYSKQHFETLLKEINLMNANGIRIYFGAYEEEHPLAPGQQCLLMVPTRISAKNTGNEDIIYENEPNFEDRVNASTVSRSVILEEETPRPFNYGSPCPPIC